MDSVTEAIRRQQEAIRSDGVGDRQMTDIVERLRGPIIDGDTLDDAAAEIERLQSELATSRELCTKFEMAVGRDVETILELRNQLVSVKHAGNQALRQWKMYAETEERDNFETEETLEGAEYRWCKSALSDD